MQSENPATSLSAGIGSTCTSQIQRRSDTGQQRYTRTHIHTYIHTQTETDRQIDSLCIYTIIDIHTCLLTSMLAAKYTNNIIFNFTILSHPEILLCANNSHVYTKML